MKAKQRLRFQIGQIWLSPKGFAYLVVGETKNGIDGKQTTNLRLGTYGMGRLCHRSKDATEGWKLFMETEEEQ